MVKKLLIGLFFVVAAIAAIVFVLASENALVFHPKGVVARNELEVIIINMILMWIIIIPTYIFLFVVVWKYCIKQETSEYEPEHSYGPMGELIMWILPTIIVIPLAIMTWKAAHQLDPYKALESKEKPITIQVVAMNWKWLFIYPEQGIATLNYLYIPERTPIHLKLSADHAPMNSFWIPQLSGQIYAMAGMTTQLFLMSDGPGEYVGKAVEINGEGYADMTFRVKSHTQPEFEQWIAQVKKSPLHLTEDVYNEMIKPAINKSTTLFSEVDKDLYNKIVEKYMYPTRPVL